jgi:hypothetical protein
VLWGGGYLNAGEHGAFGDAVVAGVDDAFGFGPALLGRADGRPEDSLAAAAGVTVSLDRMLLRL